MHSPPTWLLVPALTALLLSSPIHSRHASAQDRWSGGSARTRADEQSSLGGNWQGSNWLGGNNLVRKEWRLGIQGDNTETGVLIREVTPNSAAAKARLEVGDMVVAVEGYQVGMVSGRLYDLPDELNRHADTTGSVTLLVQDHISGRLASIRAQLDSNQSTLSGALVYSGRVPLPSDAIVTVQIENLSRPHYTVKNGQVSFAPTNGGNIAFVIAYDAKYVDPQDTYQVRAAVSSRGRTIFHTPNPQYVITKGNPKQVRLSLVPLNDSLATTGTAPNGTVVSYPNYNALDDQIKKLFQQFFERQPTTLELAALRATPGIETQLELMPLALMANQEYFDRAGNNNVAWLDSVFQVVVKKRPSQSELEQWMRRYAELGYSRTELLKQLKQQARR